MRALQKSFVDTLHAARPKPGKKRSCGAVQLVSAFAVTAFIFSNVLMFHYMHTAPDHQPLGGDGRPLRHLTPAHPVVYTTNSSSSSGSSLLSSPFPSPPPPPPPPPRPFCEPWPLCALPPRPPRYWKLCDLLQAWRPEDASRNGSLASLALHGGGGGGAASASSSAPLPRFNFSDAAERAIAMRWRDAELPFVLVGIPQLERASKLWDDAYLRKGFHALGKRNYKVERSSGRNGHFLYFSKSSQGGGRKAAKAQARHAKHALRGGGGGGGSGEEEEAAPAWLPPEMDTNLDYEEFERIAAAADEVSSTTTAVATAATAAKKALEILYLTVSSGVGGSTDWIVDGLSMFRDSDFFHPGAGASLLPGHSRNPSPSLRINCRLGMKGAIQAAHYDHGQNFIAIVRGSKRYLIQPPSACDDLLLLSHNHPSARHSSFDWAAAEETFAYTAKGANAKKTRAKEAARGKFCATEATEIILQAGELLYLPSYWFHYIVSLERNVQCNSRSGYGGDADGTTRKMQRCMHSSTLDAQTGGW